MLAMWMPIPYPVLDEGIFTRTYKYVALLGLIELCLENTTASGAPPDSLTTPQLAEKVISVLTDDELRHRLEAGALKWAAQFNWDHAAEEFMALCHEVAGTE